MTQPARKLESESVSSAYTFSALEFYAKSFQARQEQLQTVPYNYAKIFWLFAACHLFLWTLFPTLICHNLPLDVSEGLAWGREWLIGTYKHPPMQAWVLEIMATLTDRAPWAHLMASALAIVIAFWAVWRLGQRLTTPANALLGVMLLEGVAYYNFTTPEFNPNVLQLPFWALTALAFHRAVTENRWYDWLQLGVWAAGSLYTKYFSLLFLCVLGLVMLLHPTGRQHLRNSGPYLAGTTALVLLAPHVQWLITNDFLPMVYAQSRIEPVTSRFAHITAPLGFFRSQIVAVLFAILLLFSLRGIRTLRFRPLPHGPLNFNDVFLHAIAMGPLLVVLIMSLVTGERARDMWGAPLWNFFGLWLISFVISTKNTFRQRRFGKAFIAVCTIGLLAGNLSFFLGPYLHYPTQRVHFPGRAMAEAITNQWNARFNKFIVSAPRPLSYIVGDTWLAANVAYYAPGFTTSTRPHISIFGNPVISPWAAPEDIAAAGGVLVWCSDACKDPYSALHLPDDMVTLFPAAEMQQPLILPRQTHADVPPAIIGWAIIPPGMVNNLQLLINKPPLY